jgi:hypothetical protein
LYKIALLLYHGSRNRKAAGSQIVLRLQRVMIITTVSAALAVGPLRAMAAVVRACDILSQAQAAALYGAPVGPGSGTINSCLFPVAGPDGFGVVLNIESRAMFEQIPNLGGPQRAFDEAIASLKSPTSQFAEVAGLGERATLVSDQGGETILVMGHDSFFYLAITSRGTAAGPDLIKAARDILAKL